MMATKIAVATAVLAVLGTTNASPSNTSTGVQWQACDPAEFNNTVTLECGSLLVPLDYTSPNSTDLLQLQLIRSPAIVQPSKGSILFNFGGPGEPGRTYFNALVTELFPYVQTSPRHVSFRDTNKTKVLLVVTMTWSLLIRGRYTEVHIKPKLDIHLFPGQYLVLTTAC